ncbi:hypothetical protein HPB47_005855 [Ixodes persulcatus]|uniref:Uncharacterized protein n=1 Tax=Ixodes persulcatus TaxID=34615 RepID=A0AC60PBU1_IXOPE|nr:hypothetical protein HPB47_005855 [Ixodes persulcatus]
MKAIQSIGKGTTALSDFFATMNLSHRGLHHKIYQGHMNMMVQACNATATECEAANVVRIKELYKDMDSPPGNIDVVFDAKNGMQPGHMEVEAALCVFWRSLEKHKLRYTTMLSDGDSRTFHALTEDAVYEFLKVEKKTASTTCTNGWGQPCVDWLTRRRPKVNHLEGKDGSRSRLVRRSLEKDRRRLQRSNDDHRERNAVKAKFAS